MFQDYLKLSVDFVETISYGQLSGVMLIVVEVTFSVLHSYSFNDTHYYDVDFSHHQSILPWAAPLQLETCP